MIRLLLADVLPLEDPAAYSHLYDMASSGRRRAADSFRFMKDRRLSVGASALLDAGLREFGLRERDMSYGRSEYGKPFFLNAPDIHFNISHSATKVAVAFSDREVGCDIEEVADIELKVAERFLSKDEYLAIKARNKTEDRNEAFFRYWTLKESYMKATGLGLALAPDSFSVRSVADKVGDVSSIIQAGEPSTNHDAVSGDLPDSGFSLLVPDSFSGYTCALCFRHECGVPEVEHVSLFFKP